jgi:type I restriction enzyme, S subunit
MNWLPAELGDLLTLEYGRALPRAARDDGGGTPVAGSNGIDGFHSVALVDGPGIVVGRKGSAGKVTWFEDDFWPIDTTYFVQHDPQITNLRWLYYALRSKKLERLSKTTGVPGLNRNDAYAERCLLPSLSEQSRIVEILDEADRLGKLRREADSKAARILSALFLKMFGDPVANPMGFRKMPLGQLIKVKSGNFLPAKDMAVGGLFPVYGGNGVNGYHNEYMFEDRKIVIGRVGAYCGAIHYSESTAWITDNALYVSDKQDLLDDYYLIAALKQLNLNQYAGRAGQPLVSGSRIYPVEILVPPEGLQTEFSNLVSRLIELDGIRVHASERLDQLSDVLTSAAFSGQLTAKWREAHIKELLGEMEQQARSLSLRMPAELENQP